MYKKGTYIAARAVGFLAFLVLALLLAVQTPYVQTKVTQTVLSRLVRNLDSRISYDELQVMPSGVLQVKNIAIVDSNPYTEDVYGRGWEPEDTLFRARSLTATFSLKGLLKKEGIHFGRLTADDAYLHIVNEPNPKYGNNLQRIFKMPARHEPAKAGGNIFDARKVRVNNFRFRLNSFHEEHRPYSGYGINFEDLDVTLKYAMGRSMKLAGGKMYATLDKAEAFEKSGYTILSLSGNCEVGQGKTLVENLHLRDRWSDLKVGSYSMNYHCGYEFRNYTSAILMEAHMRHSKLSPKSLSYLTGGFGKDSDALVTVRGGNFKGYVNDFRLEGLDFTDVTSGVSANVSASVIGLPDISSMIVDTRIKGLKFTTAGLSHLASGLVGKKVDFSGYAPGQQLNIDLTAKGPLDRLKATAKLNSKAGSADVSADIRNIINGRTTELSATASTKDLDLGAILGNEKLGEATLFAKASTVLTKGSPSIRLDSLQVSRLGLLGYDYRNISAKGSLSGGTVNGSVICADPNLQFSLTGLMDLKPVDGCTRYKLLGDVPVANLHELKLDTRGIKSDLKFGIYANVAHDGDMLIGDAILSGVVLENDEGVHDFGDVTLRAHSIDNDQSFRLSSAFVDASLVGSHSVLDFINDLQNITSRRDLSALYADGSESGHSSHYDLNVEFHDTRILMGYIAHGAYIEDGTNIRLEVNDDDALMGEITSGRIAYNANYLKDIELQFDNMDGSLNATLTSSALAAGKFKLVNPTMSAYAADNDLALGVQFDSFSSAGGVGELYVDGQIYRDQDGHLVVKAHPLDSYFQVGEQTWTFDESDIVLDDKDIYIDGFKIRNGKQFISVDGGLTQSRSDTLSVAVNELDLGILNEFIPNGYGFSGTLNGKARATSTPGEPVGMLLNFKADSLNIGGRDAGTITISSIGTDEGREIGIYLLDRIADRDAMFASGTWFTSENRLDMTAYLDEFPLSVASPFVSKIFSSMGGSVSGKITATGPLDDISVSSEHLNINDAALKVAYTGVEYTVRGPLSLDDEGLHFDGVGIRDDADGTAELTGTLFHEKLKNFSLSSKVSFENLKVIDIDESESFYGHLRASGNATLDGPLNALVIDGNVSTSGPGEIHVPMSGSLSGTTTSNLLTFTGTDEEKVPDTYEQMLAANVTTRKVAASDMRIRAHVNVMSDVAAYIEIDKSTGNVASFTGNGGVNLNLRPSKGVFDFNGDYTINQGDYQFELPGVLSKDFQIESGSSVKFGGDILDAELDINATYGLKTDLSALITDTTSVSSRRQVNCGLQISNRLRNPELDFSIDIPDLDPTTKSQVEGALNTSDKIQKQFVALLLMGSFIPSESSGVFNGTEVLYSSVTSLMASQINNILQKLEIPLDIGIGYMEGVSGNNIFDVAVSTQLFNNRVVVGGSVGNRNYRSSANSSEMVGDLDISVKLDDEGKFRFNIFSHSADDYTSYIDNSQRNGIGISYQKEFNNFWDYFKSLFSSKKAKERRAAARIPLSNPDEEDSVTINIDKNDVE